MCSCLDRLQINQGMNGDDGGVTDKQPPDKVGGKDNQSASNRQQPLFYPCELHLILKEFSIYANKAGGVKMKL